MTEKDEELDQFLSLAKEAVARDRKAESEQARARNDRDRAVRELLSRGMSMNRVAVEIGVSKSLVNLISRTDPARILREAREADNLER